MAGWFSMFANTFGDMAKSTVGAIAQGNQNRQAAAQSYMLNEMAASSADTRGRQMYYDINSPQAQVRNLIDAGLSPGMMYGGGGAGGTQAQSGAQGSGATVQAMNIAQIMQAVAQTELIKSQTRGQDIQNNNMQTQYDKEFKQMDAVYEGTVLDNVNKRYQNTITSVEAWIADSTKHMKVYELENTLKIQNEQLYQLMRSNQFTDEMWVTNKNILKAQYNNIVANTALTKEETNKLKEEIAVYKEFGRKLAMAEINSKEADAYLKTLESGVKKFESAKYYAILKGVGTLMSNLYHLVKDDKFTLEDMQKSMDELFTDIMKQLGESPVTNHDNHGASGGGEGGGSR